MSAGADEYLDALDDLGRPLGVLSRAEVHRRGLWHCVFHCLVVSGRAGGSAVLQRRADNNAAFAGCYDLSAGGDAMAVDLGIGDLVPGTDDWITLMVMARRFLDGERPLAS